MNFGLVGAGAIGRVRARALEATAGCKLVAVADAEIDRARAIGPSGSACFSDYRELLRAPEVQAVVISTPPTSHEEITVAALEAGKHVLCEKPLSNSVASCERMVEVARRAGRLLTTGFNHRYFPSVKFLKETLASGQIGTLDHVRAFAGHLGLSEFQASWMHSKDVIGGGALMDVGIHIIDLTRYVLGEVSEVFGAATGNVWKLDRSEDNGFALLRSPEGKVATLHATWTEWKGYRFYLEAYGDRGMVRAYYAPMFAMAILMDRPGGLRRRRFRFYPEVMVREKLFGWQTTTGRAFQEEFRDFVRLARGETVKPQILADGTAGLCAVEIANAIYESSAARQPIALAQR